MSALDDFGRFARHRVARGGPYGLGLTLAVLVTALALGLFAFAVDSVAEQNDLYRFDAGAHAAVYAVVGPQHEAFARGVTWFGNNATIIALVVIVSALLLYARKWTRALRVLLASGVGGLVVLGLKTLFHRARPLEQVIPATGYSFPSGHAFASTVFYGMMICLVWHLVRPLWARWLLTVLGVLGIGAIGLSRVYLNVHFLTDVIAGWTSGTAWLLSVLIVVHVMEARREARHQPVTGSV